MPMSGQRKRKSYGIVRPLDEDFLVQGGDDEISDQETQKPRNVTKRKVPTKKKAPDQTKVKGGATAREKNNTILQVETDEDSDNDHETIPAKTKETPRRNITKQTKLDEFDVILPQALIDGYGCTTDNQCTLLVQVSDPKDAVALGEFGGSAGAIGRFESDPNGITLDLKGNQYRGSILPGPTCMILGFPASFGKRKTENETTPSYQQSGQSKEPAAMEAQSPSKVGELRVEGIVDEYATLVQIDDHMKKMDAIVTGNRNDNEIED